MLARMGWIQKPNYIYTGIHLEYYVGMNIILTFSALRKEFSAAVLESCAPSARNMIRIQSTTGWSGMLSVETGLCKEVGTAAHSQDSHRQEQLTMLMLLESRHIKVITIIFIRGNMNAWTELCDNLSSSSENICVKTVNSRLKVTLVEKFEDHWGQGDSSSGNYEYLNLISMSCLFVPV